MKLQSKSMSLRAFVLAITTISASYSAVATAQDTGFKEGATMVTLVNLHPDMKRKRLYALNYQLPSLLPMCTEVEIDDIGKKEVEFIYDGVTYSYTWDKHTKRAGQSLEENFKQYFGEKCDQAQVSTLSEIDQKGIKAGTPLVGMSKEGVLFAMGRPPIHATPSLDVSTWMYWSNKFTRKAVDFDESGIVKLIR